MKRNQHGMWMAAAAAALSAVLMLGCFIRDQRAGTALACMPASQVVTGLGHPETEGRLNINLATVEELVELPGIGPVKAEAIVSWRKENGDFRFPEDLIRVSGIGEATLEKVLDLITTGGE